MSSSSSSSANAPTMSNFRFTIEKFVADLVNLMVCDNAIIREYVKEFLGNDISSGLFDILFAYCENTVVKFLGSGGTSIDRNTFFIDSFISVLKMIFERAADESVLTHEDFTTITTGSVDLGSLILSFIQFINSLIPNPGSVQTFLRMKVKMCQLIEVMVTKKEIISLRQDIRFRNWILDILLGWNSESTVSTQEMQLFNDDPNAPLKNQKLIRDLDLASMKALMAILAGLPLQPSSESVAAFSTQEAVNLAQNDDPNEFYESMNEFKGKLFYKYLSFFLKVLDNCKIMEVGILSGKKVCDINRVYFLGSRTEKSRKYGP